MVAYKRTLLADYRFVALNNDVHSGFRFDKLHSARILSQMNIKLFVFLQLEARFYPSFVQLRQSITFSQAAVKENVKPMHNFEAHFITLLAMADKIKNESMMHQALFKMDACLKVDRVPKSYIKRILCGSNVHLRFSFLHCGNVFSNLKLTSHTQ